MFTYDDLESLRKKRQGQSVHSTTHHQPTNIQLANKRYLILTYNAEYDRIYYPLSLPYCGKPDPVQLMQQIRQLKAENQLYKSRVNRIETKIFFLKILFFDFSWNPMLNEVMSFVFNESKQLFLKIFKN